MYSSRENIQFVHVFILSSHAYQSISLHKTADLQVNKMHFASKMANDYSCGVFLILYNQHLCYVCFTLYPQTYRGEVAVGVCN